MMLLTPRKRLIFAGFIIGALLLGFLTMTDPAPKHPVPEPSAAFTGEVEVPEVSPIGPN
jgi:hypothetical protein